jgi:glycosyltransferase involved in cell wall biosynthesis
MEPYVSIIIPVFNAEKYLTECLDSILNQTYKNYEVICVNDGSTDSSVSIIESYASSESRLRLINQTNQNAGAARNNGMIHARGKYLLFLDADDIFESTLLEYTIEIAEKENSDIVVYDASFFDNITRKLNEDTHIINLSYIPKETPFSKEIMKNYIFNFTNSCPWNKLYRADFIRKHNLQFQSIKRANDLFFTNMSLIIAEKISICTEKLVLYRTNNSNSLQGANHKTPLNFLDALSSLKNKLINENLYFKYKDSFINLALGNCLYNLYSLKNTTSFVELYNLLKNTIFEQLDIANLQQEMIYNNTQYQQYQRIISMSALDYLFFEMKNEQMKQTKLEFDNKYFLCLPYHKKVIKIVVFAAGKFGREIYRNLMEQDDVAVVLWVDTRYEYYCKKGMDVSEPEKIFETEFDYIIVAVKNPKIVDGIVDSLLLRGISNNKILKVIFRKD